MELNLYVGTLTRYYNQNWETQIEQWAREHGYAYYRTINDTSTLNEMDDNISTEEIQQAVECWRDQILSGIALPKQKPHTPWIESNESSYFTKTLDWYAFGAMLLYIASLTYEIPLPSSISENWNYLEEPIIQKLFNDSEKTWSLFNDTIWWLPLSEQMIFDTTLPNDELATISTTSTLRAELDKINNISWNVDRKTILNWGKGNTYSAYQREKKELKKKVVRKEKNVKPIIYHTESLAKLSYSLFYQALLFSEENNLPILMDF